MAPDDHQLLVQRHPQNLIHGHQLAAAQAAGFPVLGGVAAHLPGGELPGSALDADGDLPGAVAQKLGGGLIGAAQRDLHITVADDLLPDIVGVPVFHLG